MLKSRLRVGFFWIALALVGSPGAGSLLAQEGAQTDEVSATWEKMSVNSRIRVNLKNGNKFEGLLVKKEENRLRLKLPSANGLSESTMGIDKGQIVRIKIVREAGAPDSAAEIEEAKGAEASREEEFRAAMAEAGGSGRGCLETPKTIEAARRALSIHPENAKAKELLAEALCRGAEDGVGPADSMAEREEIRIDAGREAVELLPESERCRMVLGIALVSAGRREEAVEHFRRATELSPKSIDAWGRYAATLYDLDRLEAASSAVDRGLQLGDPSTSRLLPLRVLITHELGESAAPPPVASKHFQARLKSLEDPTIAKSILGICEEAHTEYAPLLGELAAPLQIVVHGQEEYHEMMGTWFVLGHYNPNEDRIHVPAMNFGAHEPQLRLTLRHELIHAMVHARTSNCPRWLNEGLAQNLSSERFPFDLAALRARLNELYEAGDLPFLAQMEIDWVAQGVTFESAQMFYAASQDFVAYLLSLRGKEFISTLLKELAGGGRAEQAISKAAGADVAELERVWRANLSKPLAPPAADSPAAPSRRDRKVAPPPVAQPPSPAESPAVPPPPPPPEDP